MKNLFITLILILLLISTFAQEVRLTNQTGNNFSELKPNSKFFYLDSTNKTNDNTIFISDISLSYLSPSNDYLGLDSFYEKLKVEALKIGANGFVEKFCYKKELKDKLVFGLAGSLYRIPDSLYNEKKNGCIYIFSLDPEHPLSKGSYNIEINENKYKLRKGEFVEYKIKNENEQIKLNSKGILPVFVNFSASLDKDYYFIVSLENYTYINETKVNKTIKPIEESLGKLLKRNYRKINKD